MAKPLKVQKQIIRKEGMFYHPSFIRQSEKVAIISYLNELHPIWEWRYSENNPPPKEDEQRKLLRPIYWLGNWQFACLNYYHPPKGIYNRCVAAESYPIVLQKIITVIEGITKLHFKKHDIPKNWTLNTCLINFYGSSISDTGAKSDTARVGEHKDFEPGPVASISFGERAFFQFVSGDKNKNNNIVEEHWLSDCSLLIFGGDHYKERLFHRVQRVENKLKSPFVFKNISNFETRRINFTFRYVPTEHITTFKNLPQAQKSDVLGYMQELAINSEHFKKSLE